MCFTIPNMLRQLFLSRVQTHRLNNHLSIEERNKEYTYYCIICDFGSFDTKVMEKHNQSKKHILRSTTRI